MRVVFIVNSHHSGRKSSSNDSSIVALSQFWQNTVSSFIRFIFGTIFFDERVHLQYVLQTTHAHTTSCKTAGITHEALLKTRFSFFWQINQTSATAEDTERFAGETNTIACHAVALVCKQELVCVVCVRWSVLRRSAEFYSCLHRCAALSWRMCFGDY